MQEPNKRKQRGWIAAIAAVLVALLAGWIAGQLYADHTEWSVVDQLNSVLIDGDSDLRNSIKASGDTTITVGPTDDRGYGVSYVVVAVDGYQVKFFGIQGKYGSAPASASVGLYTKDEDVNSGKSESLSTFELYDSGSGSFDDHHNAEEKHPSMDLTHASQEKLARTAAWRLICVKNAY